MRSRHALVEKARLLENNIIRFQGILEMWESDRLWRDPSVLPERERRLLLGGAPILEGGKAALERALVRLEAFRQENIELDHQPKQVMPDALASGQQTRLLEMERMFDSLLVDLLDMTPSALQVVNALRAMQNLPPSEL